MKYKLKKNSGTYMYKKNNSNFEGYLAVQMLKFIGSFVLQNAENVMSKSNIF
jgi:hypothetical protein